MCSISFWISIFVFLVLLGGLSAITCWSTYRWKSFTKRLSPRNCLRQSSTNKRLVQVHVIYNTRESLAE